MRKQFIKYVSQNMLGMLGMSLYILADTYFISRAVGPNGIAALNLVLPLYNLIFAIGAMIGIGSAIRFVVERNKKNPDAVMVSLYSTTLADAMALVKDKFILSKVPNSKQELRLKLNPEPVIKKNEDKTAKDQK